ncbi:Plasma membrane sulfite pump involved in sulfite metabolism [Myotisia sp. PD_48]|nr:Plasma membrane sulfite pump involved in sulfite metabolism [Myotisia sp. PD_48]
MQREHSVEPSSSDESVSEKSHVPHDISNTNKEEQAAHQMNHAALDDGFGSEESTIFVSSKLKSLDSYCYHGGSWFAANMGTGITAILLKNLPYQFTGLHYIAVVIFVLNVALFALFLCISIVRYVLWPAKFVQMLQHPQHSMLLGTFPMGFATIVNLVVYICVPAWGTWATTLAWVLWWIDAVVSIAVCFYIPFVLITQHKASLDTMTAAWLLPIVAPIVCAASGGVVAEILPNDSYALLTVIICYIMWGMAVPFAMVILVIYFQRLALHKIVPQMAIVSTFLPIGPLGQGGFGLMQLGLVSRKVFPKVGAYLYQMTLVLRYHKVC